jgi:hypothetical protein
MKTKTKPPPTRPSIRWRQLCATCRDLLTADRTIDDFEWAEQIKCRIAALGFAAVEPPHQLTAAMRAVQRALERQWGPRPAPLMASPTERSTTEAPQQDPPWRNRNPHPQGWTSVPQLLANLKPPCAGSPNSSEVVVQVDRALTLREAERRKALRILAEGILEQVQRCEAAEQAVKEPD